MNWTAKRYQGGMQYTSDIIDAGARMDYYRVLKCKKGWYCYYHRNCSVQGELVRGGFDLARQAKDQADYHAN